LLLRFAEQGGIIRDKPSFRTVISEGLDFAGQATWHIGLLDLALAARSRRR